MIEDRLVSLGYRNTRGNEWRRTDRIVNVVHSSEFNKEYVRISWREEWKNHYAIVYDYTMAKGPVCIVPVPDLLSSEFVENKRRMISYRNSGYWWSQKFPTDHELVSVVLGFKDRWDLTQSGVFRVLGPCAYPVEKGDFSVQRVPDIDFV